jgi:hypothetical protein
VLGQGGSGFLPGLRTIDGGDSHSLAVKTDGTVWTWGHNGYGRLGDGTTTNRAVPVQVRGPGGPGVLTGVLPLAGGGPTAWF